MGAWSRFSVAFVALLVFVFWSQANRQARSQSVIQLPSFSQFSYSGSVLVPDRGAALLGGVQRSASRSARRGLARNRSQVLSNQGAVVGVQIIDHEQIDRRLLGDTPRGFVARRQRTARHADPRSVDPIAEGKALVRFARRQYQLGDREAAKYTYQLAIKILSGRLRQLAIAEYRRLY